MESVASYKSHINMRLYGAVTLLPLQSQYCRFCCARIEPVRNTQAKPTIPRGLYRLRKQANRAIGGTDTGFATEASGQAESDSDNEDRGVLHSVRISIAQPSGFRQMGRPVPSDRRGW